MRHVPRPFLSFHGWFPLCFPAPGQVVKNLHKACVKYPAWKQQHDANVKPRPCPEQNTLCLLVLPELALQRAALLENVDESSPSEMKDEKGEHSGSGKWFTVRSGGSFYKKSLGLWPFLS